MRAVVIGPEARSDGDDTTVFAVGDEVYLKVDRSGDTPQVYVRVPGKGLVHANSARDLLTTDVYNALSDFALAAKTREAELGWNRPPRPPDDVKTLWDMLK